jgi:periplasmic protein CpxP/Spy
MKLQIAALTFALALASGAALAQEEGPGPGGPLHHGTHAGFMGDHGLGLPLHQLNLTDDQKGQIKQIFQSEKPNMKPLMQQEFQSRQQLFALVTSGNFDQAKAAAIAAQESQTHVQLEVEHAKIASQIYQLLSSDQKAKVAEMIVKHQARMQEHLQKQSEPADQQ